MKGGGNNVILNVDSHDNFDYEEGLAPSKQQSGPANFGGNADGFADKQFSGNTELTEYTLPHGVTRIGRDAFAKCKNLEKVTRLFTLTEIGSQAFDECTSLREIQLPDSVRKLGYGAFYECK